MIKPYRLIDVFTLPDYGIFYWLGSYSYDLDEVFKQFLETDTDYTYIDMDYIYNHSGLKTASAFVELNIEANYNDDTGIDYKTLLASIVKILYAKFYIKWKNLADTVTHEFDAYNPFVMNVNEDSSGTLTSQATDSNTRTMSSNDSGSSSNDRSQSVIGSGSDLTFGFNSSSSVPANANTNNSDTTDSNNAEYSNSQSGSNQYEASNDYTRSSTDKRNTVRTGNIGNKSVQQLIDEYRQTLQFNFFEVVYNDIDSVLTRSKYI